MASQLPSASEYDNQSATIAVCKTMASWILAASGNKNQSHQFRLQSSLAVIGFGAVSGSLFIENDGLVIGTFIFIYLIYIGLKLDIHYLKEEILWLETSAYLDRQAIKISRIGLYSYEAGGGKIYRPSQVYASFQRKYATLSFQDFTTKKLRLAGFGAAISIGIFAGVKSDTLDLSGWLWSTETEQEQSLEQMPPMLGKLLQTPSKP